MTVSVIRLKGEEADMAAIVSEKIRSIRKVMEDAENKKIIVSRELDTYLKRVVFKRSAALNGGNGVWYSYEAKRKQFVASDYDISLSDDEDSIVVVSNREIDPECNVDVIRLNRDEHEKVQELLAEARAHKTRKNELRDEKRRVEAVFDQLLHEIALRENEEYRVDHEQYNRAIDSIVESNVAIVAAGGRGERLPEIDPPATKPVLSNDGRSIVLLKK